MGILTNIATHPDIAGILWGWQWAPNQPDGHTQLFYSFPTSSYDYGYQVSGFEAFNDDQKAAAIKAMVDKVSGTSDPGTPGTCFTASNYGHTVAGRAYALWGLTYANGSNDSMGLWNIYVSTTLKQTAPNYYVIGSCP